MSFLLQPVALESCQPSLRERRRSSISPTNSARLLSGAHSCPEGSALADDDDHDKGMLPSFNVTIPILSALAHAQLPDHAPKITIPRHFHKPFEIDTNTYNTAPSLPYSSSPTSACGNQEKLSVPGDAHSDVTNMERMQWRLASGFFAYFLCGWGDGG
jgi:hypothetical protein